MASRRILFDQRWVGDHGIGRFARELRQRIVCRDIGAACPLFSVFDPLFLDAELLRHRGALLLSPGFCVPAIQSARSVVTLHDLMHVNYAPYRSVTRRAYYEVLVKRALRRAPAVLTVSEYTRQELMEWAGVPASSVRVVYNGVDPLRYHPEVSPHLPGYPYVLYVGNHRPHKNLPALIHGFARARLAPDVRLVLSGAENPGLRAIAGALGVSGRVVFAGSIPEQVLPSYYRGAVATALVSHYEGFGLPIIESMACGTPVVTSNLTAMPEVAGGAALLINPHAVDEIAEGLSRVFEPTERAQLAERGLQRAAGFRWHTAASAVMALLKDIS